MSDVKNNLTEEEIFLNSGYPYIPIPDGFDKEKPDSEIELGITEEGEVYEK